MVTNLMSNMNRSNSFIMHAYVCMMIELSTLHAVKLGLVCFSYQFTRI